MKLNRFVEQFNQRAESYESSWKQNRVFKPVQLRCLESMIARHIEPNVVVDLGCGTGSLLRQCREVWGSSQLIGVDPAPKMIEVARTLTDAVFHVGYPEKLALANNSVDVVFSTMSFHHWNDHDKALSEINRVLKIGGYFVLGDVSMPRWFSRLNGDPQYWNPNERIVLFTRSHFEIESQDRCLAGFALITVAKKL